LVSIGMTPANAQQDHAVNPGQLRADLQKATETRQQNEAAVREVLRTDAGKEALKSAGVDYQKVDQAVTQLSDEDVARLAQRSRDAQRDFAAGSISTHGLIIIIVLIVVVIIVVAAVH
jgi:CHASE3 domain sensor protein